MLLAGYDPVIALMVASFGNILGGSTNYWLGRVGNPIWLEKLGVPKEKIYSFESRFKQYGYWMCFFLNFFKCK